MSELEKIEVHHKVLFDAASQVLKDAILEKGSEQRIRMLTKQYQNADFAFTLTRFKLKLLYTSDRRRY